MSVIQNLKATAAQVEQWAKPEINHCPTPAEFADLARQLNFAAWVITELLAEETGPGLIRVN